MENHIVPVIGEILRYKHTDRQKNILLLLYKDLILRIWKEASARPTNSSKYLLSLYLPNQAAPAPTFSTHL